MRNEHSNGAASGESPVFSVIVPVHNKEPHIRRAIESIRQQSHRSLEILVVDDASTDGSMDVVHSVDDERIRVFSRSEPGPGGYAARNLAIENARGRWLTFLDADDEWRPDHLATLDSLSQSCPDVDFLSTGWVKVDPKGTQKPDPYSSAQSSRGAHCIGLSEYLLNSINGLRRLPAKQPCCAGRLPCRSFASWRRFICMDIFPRSL